MYILYRKELYIVPEQLTKNRTHQTYRGKQVCMCEDKQTLIEYIATLKHPEQYYIEKAAWENGVENAKI